MLILRRTCIWKKYMTLDCSEFMCSVFFFSLTSELLEHFMFTLYIHTSRQGHGQLRNMLYVFLKVTETHIAQNDEMKLDKANSLG